MVWSKRAASCRCPEISAEVRDLKKKLLISIIDDDESIRIATSSLIRSLGWETQLYSSAEQFLASGSFGDVTCVISDLKMPGMCGIEMYRHLLGTGFRCPMIFISAFISEKVRNQAHQLGALCVLAKPVNAAELSRLLEGIKSVCSDATT
ncbi:response regulator transcription factor [Paraburkholderia sp. BCC1884]|uniref:response regulator transcription factor n=1 Tax=Paraburkholderia sp. BCC1884 TaxID=2562668 RepID=UPI0011833AD6|nr:response regulator [Paraburkholderia sp. BCC1884]